MSEQVTYNTTVVFADISGSSKLYKELGNDEANRRIGAAIDRLSQSVHQHRGIVIKTIGDEIMCHFRQASDAYAATIAFQRIGEESLPLRIGMAYGNVIDKDSDLFGHAVNDAAAVAKIARARQIIATEDFKSVLPESLAKKLSVFDQITLKGHASISTIYRLEWESSSHAAATSKQTVIMVPLASMQTQLTLGFFGVDGNYQTLVLTGKNVPLHIGRDPELCQLPSASTLASRDHCHIDYAHGKFVLVDHSTNGTYVKSGIEQQVYLRRQETPLLGSGEIGLG